MALFRKRQKPKDRESATEAFDVPLEKSIEETLTEEKREMIRGIVDLSETTVREVMVPRIDVDFVSMDASREELLERVVASGHSRFPVYRDSIDNVVGVLYVKDLIKVCARHEELNLEAIARKPFFRAGSETHRFLIREFKGGTST
jgi:CBS domain containing-hemolysin-like protein